MVTLQTNINFSEQICCSCGCYFIVPEDKIRSLKQSKGAFYCYNGHPQSYTKSTSEKLQEEIDALRRQKDAEISAKNREVLSLKADLYQAKKQTESPVKRKARRVNS